MPSQARPLRLLLLQSLTLLLLLLLLLTCPALERGSLAVEP